MSARPLRNNLFVKVDESLPTQAGFYLPVNTEKWREANDQIGNRGIVVMVGEGKRHSKTGVLIAPQCHVGDIVRFSELEYPMVTINGDKYLIINDQDIVGIEVTVPKDFISENEVKTWIDDHVIR